MKYSSLFCHCSWVMAEITVAAWGSAGSQTDPWRWGDLCFLGVFLLLQITGLQHLWFVDKSCHANRWTACLINLMCSCRGRGEPVFPMGVCERSRKGTLHLGFHNAEVAGCSSHLTPVVKGRVPHSSGTPQTWQGFQALFPASFSRPPAQSHVAVRNSACLAALPAVVQSCCRCRGSLWSC